MLKPRDGWAELAAGAGRGWDGTESLFVRGEAGMELAPRLSAFGFAQADLDGLSAGAGLRVTW